MTTRETIIGIAIPGLLIAALVLWSGYVRARCDERCDLQGLGYVVNAHVCVCMPRCIAGQQQATGCVP